MPAGLEGRGIGAFLRNRIHPDGSAPTTPTPGTNRAAEIQSPIENPLKETADRMRGLFKATMRELNFFPHGVRFKKIIYYDTDRYYNDQRGITHGIIVAVDKKGEISVFKPSVAERNQNEEWDLDSTGSSPASDQEVVSYALPLMAMVKARLDNALRKAVIVDRGKNLLHDGPETRCLMRDSVTIDVAMHRLSRLEPTA